MRPAREVEADCPACQEKVLARRDSGDSRLYCTQCAECLDAGQNQGRISVRQIDNSFETVASGNPSMASLMGLGAAALSSAGELERHAPGMQQRVSETRMGAGGRGRDDGQDVDTDSEANHAAMAALLNQALMRGGGETEDIDAAAGAAVPSHLRSIFHTLLPAFQRFMDNSNLASRDVDPSMFGLAMGDFFGSGPGAGGAPPASKSAVEKLERVVLTAGNITAETSRIVLHWGKYDESGEGGVQRDHGSGTLYAEQAEFGPSFVDAPVASPPREMVLACPLECNVEPLQNQSRLDGKVLVCRRGKCSFALKVLRAQDAGASAVVVVNTVETPWPFTMGDSKGEAGGSGAAKGRKITIPSVMVRKNHGNALIKALQSRGSASKQESSNIAKADMFAEIQADAGCKTCAVCQNDFTAGDECLRMPCEGRHLFHVDCIMPWLKMRNSCPTCRFELPTDNKAYDKSRAQARAQANVGQEFWDTSVS